MPEQTYNLGINISIKKTNIDNQLKAVQQKFTNFAQNLNKINQNMKKQTTDLISTVDKETKKYSDVQKGASGATNSKKKLLKQTDNLQGSFKKQSKAIDDTNKKFNKHKNTTKEANKATENWLSSYSESTAIAIKSTAIWGAATTAIYGTKRALEDMHNVMKNVDTEMIALRRVMNESLTDFKELQSAATSLGVNYAENVDKVVESMVQWGRQGKDQVEVIELTEAALLASNVAQMESAEAVDLLTAAILQFNKEAAEATEIVDRINEVANNYAVTARNLAISIRESGAAANAAGVSMDELIGITASLSAATAKSGSRIGRALRTTFSRMMGDARSSGEALGKVETALNQVGIALRSTEGEYRDMMDVLTDLATKWNDLDEVMQANVARAMGGRRRYSDVIAIVENWDMALDATNSSMNSLNSAIEENETYMDSIEAQWKQARATFEQVSLTVGELGSESLSKQLANALQSVLEYTDDVIVGAAELEKKYNTLTITISSLAGASALLIPKIKTLGTVLYSAIIAHPFVATLTGIATTITLVSQKVGKLQKEYDQLKKEKDQLNSLTEEGNQLSLEEIRNVENTIDKYEDLVNQYQIATAEIGENGSMLETLYEHFTGGFGVLDSFYEMIFKMLPIIGEQTEELSLQKEAVEELRKRFEDLSEEHSNEEDFINAVIVKLRDYNEELENTVSWISKYSVEQAESLQQDRREAKMLQEKADRYDKLSGKVDKSISEEAELRKITAELEKDFYELAAADNFGKALDDLVEEKMGKFSEGSDHMSGEIKELEKDINDLNDAEEGLNKEKQKLAKRLKELKSELENTHPDKEAEDYDKLSKKIEKTRDKYLNVIDQMQRAAESKQKLREYIQELQKEYNDFDESEFYSNIASLISIFDDFEKELDNIQVQVEDLDAMLENKLELAELKATIEDLEGAEQIELTKGALEETQDEVWGLIEQLKELEVKPDSAETIQKIKKEMEEMQDVAIEEDLVNLDKLKEEFDEQEFKKATNELVNVLVEEYAELDNRIKGKLGEIALEESTTLLSDAFEDGLSNIELSELEKIEEEVKNKLFNIYREHNSMSEEYINARAKLRKIQGEIDFREELEDLKEMDKELRDIVELEEFQREGGFIGDDLKENADIYEQTIANIFNKFQQLDVAEFGVNDDDIESIDATEEQLKNLIERYEYLDAQTDKELSDWASLEELNIILEEVSNKSEELKTRQKALSKATDVVDEYTKDEVDRLEETKSELKEYLEEVENGTDAHSKLKEAIRLLNEEIEDTDFESTLSGWRNISEEINRVTEEDMFEFEIIPQDAEKEVDKRTKIIRQSIDELLEKDLDFDTEDEFESYVDTLESLNKRIDYLDKKHKDINLKEEIDMEELAKRINVANEEFEEFINKMERSALFEEIEGKVFDKQLEEASELEKNIADTKQELKEFVELQEEAEELGIDSSEYEGLEEVISNIKTEIETLESFESEGEFFEIIEKAEEFDINDLIGVSDGIEALTEWEFRLKNIKDIIKEIENETGEEVSEDTLKELGYDEEEIEKIIENIEEHIRDTRKAWLNTIIEGFNEAADRIDENDKFFAKMRKSTEASINSALENLNTEQINAAIEGMTSGIGDALNISDDIVSGVSQGLKAASSMIEKDDSLGKSIVTAIGGGVGAAFGGETGAQIGAAAGNIVGTIGEFIWGGSEGVEEKEQAEQVNKQIDEVEGRIEDFGITLEGEQATYKNTASALEKFFGKEEWDVENLENAEKSLEELQNALSRMEQFASSAIGGLETALAENLSYFDFKRDFRSSIGQALQDAIIEKIIETQAIEKEIEELAGMMEGIVGEDGEIDEAALEGFEGKVEEVMKQSEELWEIWQKVKDDIDYFDSPEVDANQTFRAGGTRNITYNQQFVVRSQVFNGTETEAREAAKLLAPYIEEYIERQEGE